MKLYSAATFLGSESDQDLNKLLGETLGEMLAVLNYCSANVCPSVRRHNNVNSNGQMLVTIEPEFCLFLIGNCSWTLLLYV